MCIVPYKGNDQTQTPSVSATPVKAGVAVAHQTDCLITVRAAGGLTASGHCRDVTGSGP